jgi:hypothetical protein
VADWSMARSLSTIVMVAFWDRMHLSPKCLNLPHRVLPSLFADAEQGVVFLPGGVPAGQGTVAFAARLTGAVRGDVVIVFGIDDREERHRIVGEAACSLRGGLEGFQAVRTAVILELFVP